MGNKKLTVMTKMLIFNFFILKNSINFTAGYGCTPLLKLNEYEISPFRHIFPQSIVIVCRHAADRLICGSS